MFYNQNKNTIIKSLLISALLLFVLGQLIQNMVVYSLLVIVVFVSLTFYFVNKVNVMLKKSQQTRSIEIQRQSTDFNLVLEQLKTLITYLPYPMVLFNQEGEIELKNKSFELLLNDSYNENLTITSKNIPFPLKKLLNDGYLNEEPLTKTINLNTIDFQCISIPVVQDRRYKGSLLVMHDVTKLLYQEKVQKRFIADASHELKTPITAIKGMVEILARPGFDDDETRNDFIEQIKVENERLENIVNDLLFLSKLNSKTILLNKQPLDVYALVSESLRTFKLALSDKSISVKIINTNKSPIIADASSLNTIFNNLIDNVCNYSRASQLTIEIYETVTDIIITFFDDGMGIESEVMPRIFERFFRIDDARHWETGGSGLGLSITKELVEAHGGRVGLESSLNEFTRFTITFPKLTKS